MRRNLPFIVYIYIQVYKYERHLQLEPLAAEEFNKTLKRDYIHATRRGV